MSAIIISVLLALGVGGGVMVASSGGGGGGGGSTAIVDTGGSGGSTGGSTGGSAAVAPGNNGGGGNNSGGANTIAMANSTISFSGNTAIQTGGILDAAPSSATLTSRISSASLKNGKMTMQLNVFAPLKVSGTTDTYTTNETYASSTNNYKFMSGFKPTDTPITATFDLTKQIAPTNYSKIGVDRYAGTSSASQNLPILQFKYTGYNGDVSLGTFTNATWKVNNTTLFLGGRILGLNNSDFGYITWSAAFTHDDLDTRRGLKVGVQPFYIFDSSKQLKPSQYYNNTVTFTGNVVGRKTHIASCGNMTSGGVFLYGNINITLDFANKYLTGALSNMKNTTDTSGIYNFAINPSFTGVINTASNKPNFTIMTLTGGYIPLNSDGSFGQGVIVKGDTAAKDEVVGELAFAYNNGSDVINLAFGATK